MNMNNKALLYLRLSKDAEAVAKRERGYANQARYERKFAGKDAIIAHHKKQPARIDDDKMEYKICMDFYHYRMNIANHYEKLAKKYKKMAMNENKKRVKK